jgi:hypothetical protein
VFRYGNSINSVNVLCGFAGNNVRFRYCDGTFCCEDEGTDIVMFATKDKEKKGHEGISLCGFVSLLFVAMAFSTVVPNSSNHFNGASPMSFNQGTKVGIKKRKKLSL